MLELENVHTDYFHAGQVVSAVRGVSISVAPGQAVALVGESGSGKSTVVQSILRMVRPPVGRTTDGSITVNGVDVMMCTPTAMRSVLRSEIGFIPQDPTTALDPLYTIRSQIREVLSDEDRRRGDDAIVELLESLGIVNARQRLGDYPHEFSGGMRQRVAIAIALAKRPSVLIADEPTTALDVTTQVGILRLIDNLRVDRNLATLFITHNMRVARLLCQHVVVMYGGRVVESGPIEEVVARPRHPYTRALMDASVLGSTPRQRLRAIPGNPPSLTAMPPGCPFEPRCPNATSECSTGVPEPVTTSDATSYQCWNPVTT